MRLAVVALGGALGAAARFAVGQWLNPPQPGGFPWGTLTANLLGSLALGLLFGCAARRGAGPLWTEGVGTGFIGSFTTFSAFGAETAGLLRHGAPAEAAAYAVASVLLGYGAAAAGIALGRGRASAKGGGRDGA